jgi:hypothetical protein
MNTYYVYAYIRNNGTPYYIGKGKGNRAWADHGRIKLPPKNRIIILESNLTDLGACAIERRLIRWHGKKIEGGILLNISDGGNGGSVFLSEESRKKLSDSKKGKSYPKLTEANRKTAEKRRGIPLKQEVKDKLSKAMQGRVMTIEHKENLSKAGIGRPVSEETKEKMRLKNSIKFICPHCEKEGGGSAMKRYHFDNCKLK